MVLVVAPDRDALRKVVRRLSGRPFTWVYLGQDIGRFGLVRQSLEGRGAQLDTTSSFHQAAEALREPYLGYVYGISRRLRSLRWWLTSVSYRSGYISKTFHQACYLKLALDLAGTWQGPAPLVMVVADEPVRRAFQRNATGVSEVRAHPAGPNRFAPYRWVRDAAMMAAHRLFFVARHGRRLVQARQMMGPPNVPTEATTLLISSAHSGNVNRGGDFHKASFGDLAVRIGELGYRVATVPLVLHDVPYREALRRVRNTSLPLLVPHRYLRFRDVIWAAVCSWRRLPLRDPLPPLSGMDITPLVMEELRTDWISNRAADGLLMLALVRRWATMGAAISRIIYRYENQPWERALCWGARSYLPEAKLVGYQHARAPRLYLNYYLAPGEESEAPLPDLVVTIGKHTAGLLSSDGYGPRRVRVGGALHIPGLDAGQSRGNSPTALANDGPVLVACSFGMEEAVELAEMAAQLFDEDDGVRVVIKCHPLMPFRRFQPLMRWPLPKHVQVSEEPITGLILKSSIMVYTGSMVCVQALAARLPVVHLRSAFDLDIDPLGAVPEARPEATGLEELGQKVRWLLARREEYIARQRDLWARLVDDIYGPVTDQAIKAFVE